MRETLGVRIDCKAASKSLEQIERQIESHRTRLCELAPVEAQTLASNVKGLSVEHASALLVALSDKAFANRDQLVAFVGLDIRVRQSGKWQGKQVLSKRGSGYLRKVLFQVAWGLKMHNPMYQAYYEKIRERGKRYKTVMIAVARKFLRFLFAYFWKRTISFSVANEPTSVLVLPALESAIASPLSTV